MMQICIITTNYKFCEEHQSTDSVNLFQTSWLHKNYQFTLKAR